MPTSSSGPPKPSARPAFLALQKEYEKVPDVTRTRLYLEAMQRILPKVQLYVIDSDKGRVPLHLRVTGQ